MSWDKLDADGYPTTEYLREIREWKVKDLDDAQKLLEYIADGGWHYPEFIARASSVDGPARRVWWVSTGGWSGNEEVIEHMQRNSMFWMFAWMSTRRGGHYMFATVR